MDSQSLSSELIKGLLSGQAGKNGKTKGLYDRYLGQNLPIYSKNSSSLSQVNNRINNDYRGIIVNQKIGYLFGNPVTFSIDSTKYDEAVHLRAHEELQYFLTRNFFDDVNYETAKRTSASQYAGWLLYMDKESNERIKLLNPWEFVTIEEGDETILGLRYYGVERAGRDGKTRKATRVEAFDKAFITYYIESEDGEYVLDREAELNPRPHRFGGVPLVKVYNNDEEQGDFEKVERLIDAYDYLISSMQDEAEAFRLAYLGIYGAEIDEEALQLVKRNGIFQGLSDGMKVEFITKQINDTFFQNHKNTLNENIYKFASAIDMSDEKFSGGGESGESRKWKLISLENSAIVKERKFTTAYRKLFQLLCNSWTVSKQLTINYLDVYFTFKRNIPVDLLYIADVATKFKGQISDDTRLSLLNGVVDDVEFEKQKMEEEAGQYVNLLSPQPQPVEEDSQAGDE